MSKSLAELLHQSNECTMKVSRILDRNAIDLKNYLSAMIANDMGAAAVFRAQYMEHQELLLDVYVEAAGVLRDITQRGKP